MQDPHGNNLSTNDAIQAWRDLAVPLEEAGFTLCSFRPDYTFIAPDGHRLTLSVASVRALHRGLIHRHAPVIIIEDEGWSVLAPGAAFGVERHGKFWITVEHAYQASKFREKDKKIGIWRSFSPTDARAKAESWKEDVRADWEQCRLAKMRELCELKMATHPLVRQVLLLSAETPLVFRGDDAFLGMPDGVEGENHLGKIWMDLRAELLKGSAP